MSAFPGQQAMHQMGQAPGMQMPMGANMGGPHMVNVMSPGMMNHPPPNGMPMNQLSQQMQREQIYRAQMQQLHKNGLPPQGPMGNILPQGGVGSPSNPDGQFAGGPPGPGGQNRMGQGKGMPGMMPPPSPGMNAAKIMGGQNKDPNSGESSAPNASPQNAAAGVPQGPPGASTAPPTPSAGGMTAPSPQGMLSNNGTPAMAPSHPPVQPPMSLSSDQSIISPDFLQSVASLDSFPDSLFGGRDQGLAMGMDFERDFDEWFNPDINTGGLSF
ncbi:hypothetical protein EVJ58_g7763 [Rhodofomes roseus]|uniref:Uncharacterized protein n=1 Tax=Rhodofomes roseus TaxID=34475 RepID=A0A4Y9Y3R9_9APHY|nr:hypothetical protein EVJ58_g7763 [Rhodofomes roseus]